MMAEPWAQISALASAMTAMVTRINAIEKRIEALESVTECEADAIDAIKRLAKDIFDGGHHAD